MYFDIDQLPMKKIMLLVFARLVYTIILIRKKHQMKYHFLIQNWVNYAQPKERSCQNKSKEPEIQVIPGPTNLPEITKELLALYRG